VLQGRRGSCGYLLIRSGPACRIAPEGPRRKTSGGAWVFDLGRCEWFSRRGDEARLGARWTSASFQHLRMEGSRGPRWDHREYQSRRPLAGGHADLWSCWHPSALRPASWPRSAPAELVGQVFRPTACRELATHVGIVPAPWFACRDSKSPSGCVKREYRATEIAAGVIQCGAQGRVIFPRELGSVWMRTPSVVCHRRIWTRGTRRGVKLRGASSTADLGDSCSF